MMFPINCRSSLQIVFRSYHIGISFLEMIYYSNLLYKLSCFTHRLFLKPLIHIEIYFLFLAVGGLRKLFSSRCTSKDSLNLKEN